MNRVSILSAATLALVALDFGGAAACIARSPEYTRARDLPQGASQALGFAMADAGEPFRETDVVVDPAIPSRRFVHAVQVGCRLTIEFEQGGRGSSVETVALVSVDGRWIRSTDRERR